MKNIFEHVTWLDLGVLVSDGFESFQKLPEKCPNLGRISLEIGNFDYKYDDDDLDEISPGKCYRVGLNYLEAFRAFQKLERINLDVRDMFTLIRDFILPSSIKIVKLGFENYRWSSQESVDFQPRKLKEDPMFIKFFERWSHLNNLDILELQCPEEGDPYKGLGLDFAQEILKRILKLRELVLYPGTLEILDLVSFLKPLGHITEGLEVLRIYTYSAEIFVKENYKEEVQLPKLKKLKLDGRLVRVLNVENLIGFFGKKKGKIELRDPVLIGRKEFLRLMGQLNKIESLEDLEIDFRFYVENTKGEPFIEGAGGLEMGLEVRRNVSLYIDGSFDSETRKKLEPFGRMFKKFRSWIGKNWKFDFYQK